MSPHCLHILQTNIFQFSVFLLIPPVLLVHLLSNSGINIILLALLISFKVNWRKKKKASIWTCVKGRIKLLNLAQNFLFAVTFICCGISHDLGVPKVTTWHLRTEGSTGYTSWNKNVWSPKMMLLRKPQPFKGCNSIMGEVRDNLVL